MPPRHNTPLLITLGVMIILIAALASGWLLARHQQQQQVFASPLPTRVAVQPLPLPPLQVLPKTPQEPAEPALVELPVRGDLPRYLRNAHPQADIPADTPVIAVILDDMGVHVEHSEAALTLPPQVTFAFLPYGRGTADQAKRAHQSGHEIMVHIPMQPLPRKDGTAADAGPNALTIDKPANELARLTALNIEQLLPYAVGANNHMGSAFTGLAATMRPVLEVLAHEQLLFVDSLTTADSAVSAAAKGLSLPLLTRDTFLDHVITRKKIDASLAHTERVAIEKGYAIAIGHPHPATVAALQDWATTLAEKNLRLVPISHLVQYVRAEDATPKFAAE